MYSKFNEPHPPPAARAILAETLLAFLIAAAIIVSFNLELLSSTGIVGKLDYSANDVLIQDAKHFGLLHGNYSRVGFFHPGPFYFQSMAAVEWLATDVLGWVATPIAAHALFAFLFHAAAISVLYMALRSLFASRLFAISAVLAMLAITRLLIDPTPAFFVGLWMPYLYMPAAMLVLAACIGLVSSGWRWLPVGVAGLCMLVHGHGSFIGLVPVMTVTGGATLWLIARRQEHDMPGLFGGFAALRRPLAVSALILAVFALPILANTILNFPGEIPKYFQFAGQERPGSVMERLAFFGQLSHWTLLAIPVLLVLPARNQQQRNVRAAVLVALATVLPASLLYVLKGVNTLEYKYPIWWCAVFIGGAAAIACLGLIRAIPGIYAGALAVAAAVASVVSIPAATMRVDEGVGVSQDGETFVRAAAAIEARTAPGTYAWIEVADINNGEVVFDLATLAAVDKRREHRICVRPETLHVMYPPSLSCNATTKPPALLLRAQAKAEAPTAELTASRVALVPVQSMQIGDSEAVGVSASKAIFAEGWSAAAPTGRRTNGSEAVLLIPSQDLPSRFALGLKYSALQTPEHPARRFIFKDAAGHVLARTGLALPQTEGEVTLQMQRSRQAAAPTMIRIVSESPKSRSASDQSEAGLLLTKLEIIPAADEIDD